jgi:hypothetical protein
MTRNFYLFLGTFIAGALLALMARAAKFKPDNGHAAHSPAGGDYAAMVSNPLTPAATPPAGGPKVPAADPHAQHTATAAPASNQPVNSVCAICGMAVDPKLPTLEYQGKTVGFGCRICAPKFMADPDRYGPLYLKNETVKR